MPLAAKPRPNIIIVIADDQPYDGTTPKLSANPQGDWVDFPNSFVAQPLCGPNRVSILTGQWPRTHGIGLNADNVSGGKGSDNWNSSKSFMAALQASGYKTAHFGKYLNNYPGTAPNEPAAGNPGNPHGAGALHAPPGYNHFCAVHDRIITPPGNYPYYNYTLWENGVSTVYGATDADYFDDVIFGKAQAWMQSAPEPWALIVCPWGAHGLRFAPTRHATAFTGVTPTRRGSFNEADITDKPPWLAVKYPAQMTTAQIDTLDENHRIAWRQLLAVDDGVDSLVAALAARSAGALLNRTVIFYTTDNSNAWGEHRLQDYKLNPYEECIQAKLRVRWPGAGNRTEPGWVNHVDIAATCLDISGARPLAVPEGMSLRPLLDQAGASLRSQEMYLEAKSGVIGAAGGFPPEWYAVRTPTWKWVEWRNPTSPARPVELYDLTADPFEQFNLAGNPTYATTEADMRLRLKRLKGGLTAV